MVTAMKIVSIIFFLLSTAIAVNAQIPQPSLLYMRGFGGNDYENWYLPKVSLEGKLLLNINSSSTFGNINTSCVQDIYGENLFQKYDESGTTLEWEKCYKSNPDSGYYFLFPVTNKNIVLGGASYGGINRNFRIKRLDENDNLIWSKQYGGSGDEFLKDMLQTEDGGFIMYGESYSNDGDVGNHYGSLFSKDIWVLKIDSNGNKTWSTVIGGTSEEHAYSIIIGPNKGYYIIGSTESNDIDCSGYHGLGDAYIARLDSNGSLLWHRDLGGSDVDGYFVSGCSNGNGGILIANGSKSMDGDVHHALGNYDFWLINVDSSNNILWDKSFGSIYQEIPKAICKAKDGTIWIGGASVLNGGQVEVSYGNGDGWLIHTDSIGNFINAKVFGASEEDDITILMPLVNGTVLVGGTYAGPGPIGGEFPSIWSERNDIFMAAFAPWDTYIDDIVPNNKISLYPNPATSSVSIVNSTKQAVDLRVMDMTGNIMLHKNISGDKEMINISNWPKGIYLLHGILQDGTTCTCRFVHE